MMQLRRFKNNMHKGEKLNFDCTHTFEPIIGRRGVRDSYRLNGGGYEKDFITKLL